MAARDGSAGVYCDREEALDDAVNLLRRRKKLIEDVNHGIEQIGRGIRKVSGRRRFKFACG
jgi:hypothetical protein